MLPIQWHAGTLWRSRTSRDLAQTDNCHRGTPRAVWRGTMEVPDLVMMGHEHQPPFPRVWTWRQPHQAPLEWQLVPLRTRHRVFLPSFASDIPSAMQPGKPFVLLVPSSACTLLHSVFSSRLPHL